MRLLDHVPAFAYHCCGVLLHRGQVQVLESEARDKTIAAGRRWGKTTLESVGTIRFALRYPETSQFLIAPTQDQAGIIFSNIHSMLLSGPLQGLVRSIKYSPFPQIELASGSLIQARSVGADGKYLRGHHADRIVADECAFIPDEPMSAVVMPMLAASKFQVIERISTPFGRNHFFESWANGNTYQDEEYASFHFPTWTAPHISQKFLASERARKTKLAWDVEYAAIFNEDQNAMFPWRYIERCLDGDLECPEPPRADHRYVIGYDPAKWRDRSAVVVMDYTTSPFRVVALQDLGGRDFHIQEEMISVYAERYNNAVVLMDSTSHQERSLVALQHLGVEAYGYQFSNNSKWELMEGAAMALEHQEVRLPRHPELLQELRQYELLVTKSGLPKMGAPDREGAFDDYATAWALALAQARHMKLHGQETVLSFI